MSIILVVDDQAIVREPIAASLRLAGYETICAVDGPEAVALVKSAAPELIILDVAMPGMSGLEVLEAIRCESQSASTPVILLTAMADKQMVVQAAQSGVKDYLLKSQFSLQELLARVKKYLDAGTEKMTPPVTAHVPETVSRHERANVATPPAKRDTAPNIVPAKSSGQGEIPQLLKREECIKRAEEAMDARALSGVAAQVISLAASPRGDLEQLASLIGRDPALSARVLQAANSAAYISNRGPVTNIPDAVRQVGCSTVRNIASTVGIYEAMSASADANFNPIRSWQHSFAVATLCEQLCLSARPELGGTAHIVGLCHDLGEILFRTHFAAEYKQVLEVHEQTGQSLVDVERQMLGMPHGELVCTIIRKMGLPDVIRQSIETFHGDGSESSTEPLVRIIRVAEAYSNGLGLASSGASLVRPLTRNECRAATGLDTPNAPDSEQFRAEIYALTAMLARLSQAHERELMVPLHSRRNGRVWLAREAGFSPFDPISTALEMLGEVTVKDRLPATVTELADHTAVAVVTRTPSVKGFLAADIDRIASLGPHRLPVLWLCARPEGAPPQPIASSSAIRTLDSIADFAAQAPMGQAA